MFWQEKWTYVGIYDGWQRTVTDRVTGVENKTTIVAHLYISNKGNRKVELDPTISNVENIKGFNVYPPFLWKRKLFSEPPLTHPSDEYRAIRKLSGEYFWRGKWYDKETHLRLVKEANKPKPKVKEELVELLHDSISGIEV
jgi:hypothetical protein